MAMDMDIRPMNVYVGLVGHWWRSDRVSRNIFERIWI